MKRLHRWRTLLTASLAVLLTGGLSRAADTPVPNATPQAANAACDTDATEATPHKGLFGRLRPSAVKEHWQNKRPLGCYGNFNHYSCGSFHSEVAFLFGSCRTFFGERCLKGPPPSPVPGFDPVALGLEPAPRRGCAACAGQR
jgi:hypothetical protein